MQIRYEKSNPYRVEKFKTLTPTIIFFHDKIGSTELHSFKFIFWKWWVKIMIFNK